MSHFAKVISGVVTEVIVAEQNFIDTLPDKDVWIKTSYNTRLGKHYAPNSDNEDGGTPLRKNFAFIGGLYDSTRDAFMPPQPYASWVLDESTCHWKAPVSHPNEGATSEEEGDGKSYEWDEDSKNWKVIEGV